MNSANIVSLTTNLQFLGYTHESTRGREVYRHTDTCDWLVSVLRAMHTDEVSYLLPESAMQES